MLARDGLVDVDGRKYMDFLAAYSAVNQGQVEAILEKPLDEALTRQTLREALAASLLVDNPARARSAARRLHRA